MGAKTMTRRMSTKLLVALLALLFSPVMHASDDDYQRALKALQAKDVGLALRYLESAISDNPDNLLYGNEYRQVIIQSKQFDRALDFFDKKSSEHPSSANLHLNYGFAYVDKIPAAGSITQVILANKALNEFTKAIELQPSWIAYYTRGESYLFWPKIFNRAPAGVADLEKAMEIQQHEPRRAYHVKTYIALGDGYWKTDQMDKARAIWAKGLQAFPGNQQLKMRLELEGESLTKAIERTFDPATRVDTDLKELWAN
jgi:tetratricopeptide (TPR) repeat protein